MARRIRPQYQELTPEGKSLALKHYHGYRACAFRVLFKFLRVRNCEYLRRDLEAVALDGLWRACEAFDPSRGVKFITYCYAVVWNLLRQSLPDLQAPYHIPRWASEQGERVPLCYRLDAGPAEYGLSGIRYEHCRDFIVDQDEPAPDAGLLEAEEHAALHAALWLLTARERKVLRARYGLGGAEPETLASIARRLGVTREAVRSTQERAIKKLRASLDPDGTKFTGVEVPRPHLWPKSAPHKRKKKPSGAAGEKPT